MHCYDAVNQVGGGGAVGYVRVSILREALFF